MASATYQSRVLVVKRTKLGETDCICTLLSQDGSQIRAVAKGARKPTSPFTSRLELFSVCDVLFAKGSRLISSKKHAWLKVSSLTRKS